jgi:hypothetical protein
MAAAILNNSLILATTEEIAEHVLQPDVLADHEYLDTGRRNNHLAPEKNFIFAMLEDSRAVLSGVRLWQISDVEATISRRREMALGKRLAVDLLRQKYLRGIRIGPVLFKERTARRKEAPTGTESFTKPGDCLPRRRTA